MSQRKTRQTSQNDKGAISDNIFLNNNRRENPTADNNTIIVNVVDDEEYTQDYLVNKLMSVEGFNQNNASDLATILLDMQAKKELRYLERIGQLEAQIAVNSCRNDRLAKELSDANAKIIDMQKRQMCHNLWINGVPEKKPETPEKLQQAIKDYLHKELEMDTSSLDFDTCHRTGDKTKDDRPVIVAFVRRDELQKVMKCGQQRIKDGKTVPHMGVQQPRAMQAQLNTLRSEKQLILKDEPQADVVIKGDKLFKDDKVEIDLGKERAAVKPTDTNLTQSSLSLSPFHGDMLGPHKGSFFQGHFVPLSDKSQLQAGLVALRSYKNVSCATHNIWVLKIGDFIRAHDDEEDTASKKLVPLLKDQGYPDGLLMVTRFYGGVHIGRKRFDLIAEAGKNALSYIDKSPP